MSALQGLQLHCDKRLIYKADVPAHPGLKRLHLNDLIMDADEYDSWEQTAMRPDVVEWLSINVEQPDQYDVMIYVWNL